MPIEDSPQTPSDERTGKTLRKTPLDHPTAREKVSLFERLEHSIWQEVDGQRGPAAFLRDWIQILDRSIQGFVADRGMSNAASLTYTSLLTLVPLLAILLVGLKGFGVHEYLHDFLRTHPIIQELVIQNPEALSGQETLSGPILVDQVFNFVERTNFANLGILGAIGLVLVVLAMLAKIEGAMNDAWAVGRSRSPWRMFIDYFKLLIVIVLMIGALSATASGHLLTGAWADRYGINQALQFLIKNIPYLMVWPAFIGMYYYMPNTHVRWRSAIAGGLVAGTLYQAAQFVFIGAIDNLIFTYGRIYGTFAILLLIFLWVFFSWGVILWGVEICSAHQNLRDLRRSRRPWRGTPFERETLALRLAALLAAPMLNKSQERMDAGQLADALGCPPSALREMIKLFQENHLVAPVADGEGYLLSRTPDQLSVLDLLRIVRYGSLEDIEPDSRNAGIFHDLSEEVLQPLARRNVRDLAATPLEEIQTLRL